MYACPFCNGAADDQKIAGSSSFIPNGTKMHCFNIDTYMAGNVSKNTTYIS